VGVAAINYFQNYNDTWVHTAIIADYKNRIVRFYRNGVLFSSNTINEQMLFPDVSRYKYVGSYSYGGDFNAGTIDDFRIYNRALSDAEIKAIYDATK